MQVAQLHAAVVAEAEASSGNVPSQTPQMRQLIRMRRTGQWAMSRSRLGPDG